MNFPVETGIVIAFVGYSEFERQSPQEARMVLDIIERQSRFCLLFGLGCWAWSMWTIPTSTSEASAAGERDGTAPRCGSAIAFLGRYRRRPGGCRMRARRRVQPLQ